MTLTRKQQLGLGLVELMVGITIGLIVTAGASMVAVNQINEHRRLMLETQIQQDLRTAADLLQQDLRRAGFRGLAVNSVWAPATGVGTLEEQAPKLATDNPYENIVKTDNTDTLSLSYFYALETNSGYNTSSTPRDNENFGFKWTKGTGTLYLMLGLKDGQPNWQPITDPDSVLIRDVKFQVKTQSIDLGGFCDKPCNPPTAGAAACPTQEVRQITFTIVGEAAHDAKVKRTLTGVERLRTDAINGACPS